MLVETGNAIENCMLTFNSQSPHNSDHTYDFFFVKTGTIPTAVELYPQRGTNGTDKAFLMKHVVFDDPYDTLLHQAAQKIFQEELAYVEKWKNIKL